MPSTALPPREYGPHDRAAHAGRTVKGTLGSYPKHGRPGRYGPFREFEIPIPDPHLKQIEAINDAAHRAGQLARRQAAGE